MYEQAFNFSIRPFNLAPFPPHYFASQSHQQALEQTREAISRAKGPVVMLGGVGTGKSLMLELVKSSFAQTHAPIAIVCSRLEQRSELLQSILFELEMPYRDMSEGELRLSLIDYLKNGETPEQGLLLLVDEADRLSIELLDELRLITNVIRDGRQQAQLVLAGTQRLDVSLSDPCLASFNQRVAVRCVLQNMSHQETTQYITAHIERAGRPVDEIFTDGAIAEIYRATDGCPRVINQLCDQALTNAEHGRTIPVSETEVRQTWAQMQNLPDAFVNPVDSNGSVTTNEDQSGDCSGSSCGVVEYGTLDDSDQSDSIEMTTPPSAQASEVTKHFEQPPHAEPFGQQPVIEQPVIEQPIIEQPIIEQPAVEQPVIEQPAVEESTTEPSRSELPTAHGGSFAVEVIGAVQDELTAQDVQGRVIEPAIEANANATTDFSSYEVDPFAPNQDSLPTTEIANEQEQFDGSQSIESEVEAITHPVVESFPATDVTEESSIQGSDIQALEEEQQQILNQVDASRGTEFAVESTEPVTTDDNNVQNQFDNFYSTSPPQTSAEFETGASNVEEAAPDQQQPSVETYAAQPETEQNANNPFDEQFEDEVQIHDAYSPFVASQNHASLTVTSEELSHLVPLEQEQSQADSNPVSAETSQPAFDSAEVANESFATEPPPMEVSQETGFPQDSVFETTPQQAIEEFDLVDQVDSTDYEPKPPAFEATSVEPMPHPPAPTDQPVENQPPTPQAVDQFYADPTPSVPPQTPPQVPPVQSVRTEFPDTDTLRSAQLNAPSVFPVTPQPAATPATDTPPVQPQTADQTYPEGHNPESTPSSADSLASIAANTYPNTVQPLPQQPSAIDPDLAALTSDFGMEGDSGDDDATMDAPLQIGPGSAEAFVQPQPTAPVSHETQQSLDESIDASQRILKEILAQQQLISTPNSETAGQSPAPPAEPPQVDSVSIEYPITEHANYAQPSDPPPAQPGGDDRDMLMVNESQHLPTTPEPDQPTQMFPNTEPSTGEAQRMDYQQLFDRLRNLPE